MGFVQGSEFGLKTAIAKNWLGVWNGYVGLPPEHPFFGLTEETLGGEVSVHGGITWTENHLPGVEPDGLWWIGFDTAHVGDLMPMFEALPPEVKERIKRQAREFVAALFGIDESELGEEEPGEFKDYEYVAAETSYLASQLSVMNLAKEKND